MIILNTSKEIIRIISQHKQIYIHGTTCPKASFSVLISSSLRPVRPHPLLELIQFNIFFMFIVCIMCTKGFCLHKAIGIVPSTLQNQIKEKNAARPYCARNLQAHCPVADNTWYMQVSYNWYKSKPVHLDDSEKMNS